MHRKNGTEDLTVPMGWQLCFCRQHGLYSVSLGTAQNTATSGILRVFGNLGSSMCGRVLKQRRMVAIHSGCGSSARADGTDSGYGSFLHSDECSPRMCLSLILAVKATSSLAMGCGQV